MTRERAVLEAWRALIRREGRTTLILLLLVVIVGTALRLYRLGTFGWWDGEPYTILHASKALRELPTSISYAGAHPPLWYLLTHFLLYFGQDEVLLRLPAVICGIVSLPVVYLLGRSLFGREEALLGTFLLAVSPFHLQKSQLARGYSFMLLFSILSLYFLWRALKERRVNLWICFVLSTVLNLYNHYFALFVLASETIFAGLVILQEHLASAEGTLPTSTIKPLPLSLPGDSFLHRARGLALSLAAILLLYAPCLPIMRLNFFARQMEREAASAHAGISIMPSLLHTLFADLSGAYHLDSYLFLGLFLTGLVILLWQRQWKQSLLTLLWIGMPLLVVAAASPRRFSAKYVLFVLPIYLLVISVGVVRARKAMVNLGSRIAGLRWASRVGFVPYLVLVGLLAGANIPLLERYYSGDATPFLAGSEGRVLNYRALWPALVEYLDDHAREGDFIIYGAGSAYPFQVLNTYLNFDRDLKGRLYEADPSSLPEIQVWWIDRQGRFSHLELPEGYSIISLEGFGNIDLLQTRKAVDFMGPELNNAGFEVGEGADYGSGDNTAANGIPDGWLARGGKIGITLDQKVRQDGHSSLRVERSGRKGVILTSDRFEVRPNVPFRISARVREAMVRFYSVSPGIHVVFFRADGQPIKSFSRTILLESPEEDGWALLVGEGITPAGSASCEIQIVRSACPYDCDKASWLDSVRFLVDQGVGR